MSGDQQVYIMVVETTDWLHRLGANQLSLFTQKLHNSIFNSLENHNGEIIKSNNNQYVVKFSSVTDAVLCALKIQHKFKYSTPKINKSIHELHVSVIESSDVVDTITLASFLCNSIKDKIVISPLVKIKYENENYRIKIDSERIKVLSKNDFIFFKKLNQFLNSNWKNPYLMVSHLSKPLDYSESQVYNKLKSLTSKSPSEFIRDFRLRRAMESIHHGKGNISQIAKSNGFGSSSYFSSSFKKHFGISPMEYSKLS